MFDVTYYETPVQSASGRKVFVYQLEYIKYHTYSLKMTHITSDFLMYSTLSGINISNI